MQCCCGREKKKTKKWWEGRGLNSRGCPLFSELKAVNGRQWMEGSDWEAVNGRQWMEGSEWQAVKGGIDTTFLHSLPSPFTLPNHMAKNGNFTRESQHRDLVTLAYVIVVHSLPSVTSNLFTPTNQVAKEGAFTRESQSQICCHSGFDDSIEKVDETDRQLWIGRERWCREDGMFE